MLSTSTAAEIRASLSPTRISTYDSEYPIGTCQTKAIQLYAWNAQTSGALLTPLHLCEITIRNAISQAIENAYCSNWHLDTTFETSLPSPPSGYNPRRDLIKTRAKSTSVGQVISELKFVFWQSMLTKRHDNKIWNNHLRSVFPNTDPGKSIKEIRVGLHSDIESVRRLRNRVAHHEHILKRNLDDDFRKLTNLIEARCTTTALWMLDIETASPLFKTKPK